MTNIAAKDITINEAKQAGVLAFQAGINSAPCSNPLFQGDFHKNPRYMDLMEAYTYGWTIASLAAPIEGLDIDITSVIALKEIMEKS